MEKPLLAQNVAHLAPVMSGAEVEAPVKALPVLPSATQAVEATVQPVGS